MRQPKWPLILLILCSTFSCRDFLHTISNRVWSLEQTHWESLSQETKMKEIGQQNTCVTTWHSTGWLIFNRPLSSDPLVYLGRCASALMRWLSHLLSSGALPVECPLFRNLHQRFLAAHQLIGPTHWHHCQVAVLSVGMWPISVLECRQPVDPAIAFLIPTWIKLSLSFKICCKFNFKKFDIILRINFKF